MGNALGQRLRAPGVVGGLLPLPGRLVHLLRIFREPLRGVGTAAENHILDPFEQLGLDFIVEAQHLRVDDAHVHPGADGVVEEDRVHRLAHGVVAAEGEREVRDAARNLGVRQVSLNPAHRLDEVQRIAVVLGDACRHGQDVGVEDDVLGRESRLGQQAVGPFGHLDLAPEGVGLPPLVEEHHHHGGAVAVDFAGAPQEGLLALLERDGVDHGLALRHLEPRAEHLPLRRVNHRRYAGDFGLRGHQVEERAHGLHAVNQTVVHADVDNLRSGLDLGAGHREGLFVVVFADEPREACRAGHVGPLAHVDEVRLGDNPQRLQTAQHRLVARRGERTRGVAAHNLRELEDVLGRGAAAASHDVEQTAAQVLLHVGGEHLGGLVVAPHDVGKSGIGVGRDAHLGHRRQPLQIGEHLTRAVGAVEPHGEESRMRHRDPEGLDGLPREGAAAGVGQRPRDHHRKLPPELLAQTVDGIERRLGVERVEDRLDEQHVGAPFDQSAGLLAVGLGQLREGHLARGGVAHVGRHRGRAVGRPHRARDEAGLRGVALRILVGRRTGDGGRRAGNLSREVAYAVVGQRDGVGVERVGGYQVGAGLEVARMDFADDVGPRQVEQVVAAAQLSGQLAEPLAAVVRLGEPVALDHRAEAAVEQQDALLQGVVESVVRHLTVRESLFRRFCPSSCL